MALYHTINFKMVTIFISLKFSKKDIALAVINVAHKIFIVQEVSS